MFLHQEIKRVFLIIYAGTGFLPFRNVFFSKNQRKM